MSISHNSLPNSEPHSAEQPSTEHLLLKMQAYCARAERCEQDVVRNLKRYNATGQQTNDILQALKNDHFIDQKRYCQAFVHDHLKLAAWGARKVRYALIRKGIAQHIIDQCMPFEQHDRQAEINNMQQAAEQKAKQMLRTSKYKTLLSTENDDPNSRKLYYQLRAQLMRHIYSKGYQVDADEVQSAVDAVLHSLVVDNP